MEITSWARLNATTEASMPMSVFVEELGPGDGVGEAGPTSVENLVSAEVMAGAKVGEVLVGWVVDEEVEEVGWECAVTMVVFSRMLTAGIIGLEEERLLVVSCAVDIPTSTVVLIIWAGVVVGAAAESCSNKEYSLVNELAAAELEKTKTTVEP